MMLKVNAVLAGVFGLAFLVAPATTMAMWGVQADVTNTFFLRQVGTAFIGITIISWYFSSRPYGESTWTVGLAMFVSTAISTLVALNQVFVGTGHYGMRWVSVAIYGFLAVGFLGTLIAAKKPLHSVA
jgi:hypothetical protein